MRQLIKRLLPKSIWLRLKNARLNVSLKWLSKIAKRRALAKGYFSLLSAEFSRENHIVLAGIAKHRQATQANGRFSAESHPRLRRNTHRLEKGLLMRPRKPVFGLGYIEELVVDYVSQSQQKTADKEELQWAHNVLQHYFSVVDLSHPKLKLFSQKFNDAHHQSVGDGSYKPYLRGTEQQHSISASELKALAMQRRSVRWFKDTPVERHLLEQAAEIATLAPSACNRQPFRIVVIDDEVKKRQAATLPMGTAGWAENIPVFAVFVGDFASFEFARDRHVPYIDGSLAAMNFMLALETLGLSSCPINWPDIEEREQAMSNLLQLNVWERPIMCLAIGYADEEGGIAYSQKKKPSQLIQYL